MQVPLTSLDDDGAHRQAAKHTRERCVWWMPPTRPVPARPATATRSCASCMETGYRGRALLPIVDRAGRAEAAFDGGRRRRRSRQRSAATLDPKRFQPLPITAQSAPALRWPIPQRIVRRGMVRRPKRPCWKRTTSRSSSPAGPCSLYDRSLFYAHGQDPKRFDVVVVKSPHCQHHMFADWCGRLINVDAPARPARTCTASATPAAPGRFFRWMPAWSSCLRRMYFGAAETIFQSARPIIPPGDLTMPNRRDFLVAGAATAAGFAFAPFARSQDPAKAGRKKLAVVTTLWNYRSHAWHMAERFLARLSAARASGIGRRLRSSRPTSIRRPKGT